MRFTGPLPMKKKLREEKRVKCWCLARKRLGQLQLVGFPRIVLIEQKRVKTGSHHSGEHHRFSNIRILIETCPNMPGHAVYMAAHTLYSYLERVR